MVDVTLPFTGRPQLLEERAISLNVFDNRTANDQFFRTVGMESATLTANVGRSFGSRGRG